MTESREFILFEVEGAANHAAAMALSGLPHAALDEKDLVVLIAGLQAIGWFHRRMLRLPGDVERRLEKWTNGEPVDVAFIERLAERLAILLKVEEERPDRLSS